MFYNSLVCFAVVVKAFCPLLNKRHSSIELRVSFEGKGSNIAESLSAEVVRRSLDVENIRSPSPLLPPDTVVRTVLEALRRPDIPEFEAGLAVAFAFSEPEAVNNSALRSSWAWGHLRGRCDWSTRGLPILDTLAEECTSGYTDEEECTALYGARDELFLDSNAHADEIRIFFSTLLHHSSVRMTAPPRWGSNNLVEFDFVVTTDIAGASGSIDILARFLLCRAGPKDDTWYIRGIELLGESLTVILPFRSVPALGTCVINVYVVVVVEEAK